MIPNASVIGEPAPYERVYIEDSSVEYLQEKMRKENITPSDMIRGQNLFLARNLFISRSMAARFPHGALKIQPRDEKDISHWSVKIVNRI